MELPLEKTVLRLIDVAERLGVGLAAPWQMRRDARARAEVRRIEAIADEKLAIEIQKLKAESLNNSINNLKQPQISNALIGQENNQKEDFKEPANVPAMILQSGEQLINHAVNVEKVRLAENFLKLREIYREAEEIFDKINFQEHVDIDGQINNGWLAAWKMGAQTADNDDSKTLWAKILLEQILQPNKFSKRTLNILNEMSEKDAELLYKASGLVFKDMYYGNFGDNSEQMVSYYDLLELEDANLFSSVGSFNNLPIHPVHDVSGKYIVRIARDDGVSVIFYKNHSTQMDFRVIKLTKSAQELISVGGFGINIDAIRLFGLHYQKKYAGDVVGVVCARVSQVPDGDGFLPVEIIEHLFPPKTAE